MRVIIYRQPGGSDVLQLTELPIPEPGPGSCCHGDSETAIHVISESSVLPRSRQEAMVVALPGPLAAID